MIYDYYGSPKLPRNIDPATMNICKYFSESYQDSVIIKTWWSRLASQDWSFSKYGSEAIRTGRQ